MNSQIQTRVASSGFAAPVRATNALVSRASRPVYAPPSAPAPADRPAGLVVLCALDADSAAAVLARNAQAAATTTAPRLDPTAGCVRTILFTDVERHTDMTGRLGDVRARELMRYHERIVREALAAHGGAEIKAMGDGFMASFSSPSRALSCAIAMQRAFAAYNQTADEPLRVRMGLNAGEPIEEDSDLFGTAVIIAARVAARACGGEILASDVVRQLAVGRGFLFADRGETILRGLEQEPVRLHELRWQAA